MSKNQASPSFGMRLDLKIYAGILTLFDDGKMRKSVCLRKALEMFHDLLVKKGHITPVETYEEAYQICAKRGISFEDNRHDKNLILGAMAFEEMQVTKKDLNKPENESLRDVARDLDL